MAKIRSILCSSALLIAACNPIKVGPPPPPTSYLECEAWPATPDLADLRVLRFDSDTVVSLRTDDGWQQRSIPAGTLFFLQADVNARDGIIARYLVEDARGAWFSCATQLERVSDYFEVAD